MIARPWGQPGNIQEVSPVPHAINPIAQFAKRLTAGFRLVRYAASLACGRFQLAPGAWRVVAGSFRR